MLKYEAHSEQEWMQIINEYKTSGLSNAKFIAMNHLEKNKFYDMKKKYEMRYESAIPIDFRKRTNGLVGYISDNLLLNPSSSSLFLFTNKRRTSIKIIYYEKNGYWLFEKSLLNHDIFQWPKKEQRSSIILSNEQLEWLLRGMEITPKHEFSNVKSGYFILKNI